MSLQSSLLSTAAISRRKRELWKRPTAASARTAFSQAWDCAREVTLEPVRQRQASRRPCPAETFWNGSQS
jgi:hypothetical protein